MVWPHECDTTPEVTGQLKGGSYQQRTCHDGPLTDSTRKRDVRRPDRSSTGSGEDMHKKHGNEWEGSQLRESLSHLILPRRRPPAASPRMSLFAVQTSGVSDVRSVHTPQQEEPMASHAVWVGTSRTVLTSAASATSLTATVWAAMSAFAANTAHSPC